MIKCTKYMSTYPTTVHLKCKFKCPTQYYSSIRMLKVGSHQTRQLKSETRAQRISPLPHPNAKRETKRENLTSSLLHRNSAYGASPQAPAPCGAQSSVRRVQLNIVSEYNIYRK